MVEIDGLLRLPQVVALTTLSRSEIYRQIAASTFPKQYRLSHKRAVWRADEIRVWIDRVTLDAERTVEF